MGRLRHPTRWPAILVATCAVASSACGGSNPDALFQARDAAAEKERFVGMRGVAALVHGSTVTVIATTSEAAENHIVSFTDDGSSQASLTVLADAPINTAFRGIAFAP